MEAWRDDASSLRAPHGPVILLCFLCSVLNVVLGNYRDVASNTVAII